MKENFSQKTQQTPENIAREFDVTLQMGLSPEEALKRSEVYGSNEIKGKHQYWWEIFIRQFSSPFIYLLVAAAFLSFLFKEYFDAFMILMFVLINSILGFYQEFKSAQTLKLLKKYMVHRALVVRGGKEEIIQSTELVPGDIVIIDEGDIIQADMRIFQENNFFVNESVLSGESEPVKKNCSSLPIPAQQIYQANNIGFSGTTAVSGRGYGIVFAIGMDTVIGDIAQLSSETAHISSFEKGLSQFSSLILKIIFATLFVLFFLNLIIKGENVNIIEFFIFIIALAVSVIPEALPLVTTFSLSRGAMRLAKQKVVVKRLSSIEDLGSIEILCTDKTGTITENTLTIDDIYPFPNTLGENRAMETLLYGNLALSMEKIRKHQPNNAFDLALQDRMPENLKARMHEYARIRQIPFDPERRRNCVVVKAKACHELIVRGAPEEIFKICSNINSKHLEDLQEWLKQSGLEGKRVIAIGKKEIQYNDAMDISDYEKEISLIGLISFIDPLKHSAIQAIKKAKNLGVKVKILTGDNAHVAGAGAHKIGISVTVADVISGDELDAMNIDKQIATVENCNVFARVTPQQKYKIIQILEKNYSVGFLGEGINDAPALKVANVSIVVHDAADIAKDASDIILLKKSLEVIIDGIEEGRRVFANTMKYIKATLTSNFGNFYAVAISSLFISYLPMLPLQILLLNLLSDFPMIAIATDNVDAEELKKPKSYNIKSIAIMASVFGIISTFFDFVFFGMFYSISPQVLQTNWFIGSILTELVLIFSIRTHFVFYRAKAPSRIIMFLSIVAVLITISIPFTRVGQEIFKFNRPSAYHLFLIALIVISYFIVTESAKVIYYKYSKNKTI